VQATRLLAATLAATLNAIIGAYLLITANGIYIAMQERGTVWEGLTPLPSYPVARIAVYLICAMVLQLASGWLLMPGASRRDTAGFWGRYTARVALCAGGCFVAAVVMFFLVMALLDAGAI
jgi:hypothetical protein